MGFEVDCKTRSRGAFGGRVGIPLNVKDSIGDRPGKAPGPQRLKPSRDVADDWSEGHVKLSERKLGEAETAREHRQRGE